jgi:phosphate uptake regulator
LEESRKVQRVGQATLTVSLPNTWAKEHGVKQGDLITLRPEQDGSLRLTPISISERRRKSNDFIVFADLCDETGLLERVVAGNYMLGRDLIRVVSSNRLRSLHTEEVRKMARRLTGLSIIEENPREIILQCSIDPVKFPIHIIIRRLYVLASTIFRESIQSLIDNNTELAKEAISREDEADMMCWLTLRLLLSAQQDRSLIDKTGLENPLNIAYYVVVVMLLERMADWGESIAKNALTIQEFKKKMLKPIIGWLTKTSELSSKICSDAIQSLFSNDLKLANRCIETYKKIVEPEENKILNEIISQKYGDPQIYPYIGTIIWGIKRIGELGAEIAQISINKAIESPNKICEKAEEEIGNELGRPYKPTVQVPKKK